MLVTIILRLMSIMKKLKLLMSRALGPRPRRSVGGEGAEGDLGFRGLFQDITTSASSTSGQISIILGDIQNSWSGRKSHLQISMRKKCMSSSGETARSLGHTTLVDTILPLQRI